MTLRELLDKATPRPWEIEGYSEDATRVIVTDTATGRLYIGLPTATGLDGVWNNPVENAELITALANNAEAFIELWEAAEALRWEADYDWDENAVNRLVGEGELKAAVEALRPLMEGDE